jgi:hypothetical protein
MAGKDSILRIILEVTKKGDGDKQAYTDLQHVNTVLKETTGINLNSITTWGLVGAAIGGVIAIGKKLIDYYKEGTDKLLNYSEAIEKFKTLSGATVEESQVMYQMSQRLNVSYTDMSNALKMLSKTGMAPNLENLIKQAEAYQAIQDPAQKDIFLLKEFGKNGIEMAKILGTDVESLKALGEELTQTSTLTATQISQAQELEAAINRKTVAQDALQMELASKTVPWQIEINKLEADAIESQLTEMKTLDKLGEMRDRGSISQQKYDELTKTSIKSTDEMTAAGFTLVGAINQVNNANDQFGLKGNKALQVTMDLKGAIQYLKDVFNLSATDITEGMTRIGNTFYDVSGNIITHAGQAVQAIDDMTKVNENYLSGLASWTTQETDYNTQKEDHAQKLIDLEKEYALKKSQGYSLQGTTMKGLLGQIEAEQGAVDDLEAAHQRETYSVILGYMQQILAADGLTTEETQALIAQGVQWGIYDTTMQTTFNAAILKAQGLANTINGMHDKTIDITVITHNFTVSSQGPNVTLAPSGPPPDNSGNWIWNGKQWGHKASGGLLGDADIVGDEGYEAIVKDSHGQHVVIPHDMTKWLMSQGLLNVAGQYYSGGPINLPDQQDTVLTYAIPKTSGGGNTVQKSGTSLGSSSGAGGTGGSRVGATSSIAGAAAAAASQAAAQTATETVAPVVSAAMKNFQAAQQQNSQQVQQQTAVTIQGNQQMVDTLRRIENAINRQPEMLAAQIQKYRK